jgi:hypothetical protein
MGWPTRIRRLFKILYVALCVAGVSVVAYSATYGVFFQADDVGTTATTLGEFTLQEPEGQACVVRFKTLYRSLKGKAHALLDDPSNPEVGKVWRGWAKDWRKRVRQARVQCQVARAGSMKPLAAVAKDLERLEVAYESMVTGFRQVGQAPHQRLEAAFAGFQAKD